MYNLMLIMWRDASPPYDMVDTLLHVYAYLPQRFLEEFGWNRG